MIDRIISSIGETFIHMISLIILISLPVISLLISNLYEDFFFLLLSIRHGYENIRNLLNDVCKGFLYDMQHTHTSTSYNIYTSNIRLFCRSGNGKFVRNRHLVERQIYLIFPPFALREILLFRQPLFFVYFQLRKLKFQFQSRPVNVNF